MSKVHGCGSDPRLARRLTCVAVIGIVCAMTAPAMAQPAKRLTPMDVLAMPSKPAEARIAYGKGSLQFGELRVPKGKGPFPVVVVIHGGCWLSSMAALDYMSPFADALRDAGVATWNVESRRVGDAGAGWPGTFEDIAAAVDHVRKLTPQYPIDGNRILVTGHSAGAHLALWAAARSRLPTTSPVFTQTPAKLVASVPLGGPGDLRDFETYGTSICGPTVEKLLGGKADAVPEIYAQTSPRELLPFGVRQVLIVGEDDGVMPPASREGYVAKAKQAGDEAELIVVPGAHFEIVAPGTEAFAAAKAKILDLLGVKDGPR